MLCTPTELKEAQAQITRLRKKMQKGDLSQYTPAQIEGIELAYASLRLAVDSFEKEMLARFVAGRKGEAINKLPVYTKEELISEMGAILEYTKEHG